MDYASSILGFLPGGRRSTGISQLLDKLEAYLSPAQVERVREAYEFGAEMGTRWFDIFRLQLLPQVIAARSPLETPISPTNLANIQNKYYAPIPVNEMLKNPQWKQNPGY